MYSYINRELSWLKFNKRVLMQASYSYLPLGERLNFISIYQNNLDEFFMVRVGSLLDQKLIDKNAKDSKTGLTPQEQINLIIEETTKLGRLKDSIYNELLEELQKHGIIITKYRDLDLQKKQIAAKYYEKQIKPLISPMVISHRQPFPFLVNKGIYALAIIAGKNGKERLGIVNCNDFAFERLIHLGDNVYVLSEELILHYLNKNFSSYKILDKTLIRITRNADIDADASYDEDLNYRDFMEKLIKKRKRLLPVRLEIFNELDDDITNLLCEYTKCQPILALRSKSPLDLSFLYQVRDLLRNKTELFYPNRLPQKSGAVVSGLSMIEQIKKKDMLLSYPFESMKPFIDLLNEAATDPRVISIKMTLYRVASHSKIVSSLIEAAENGKNVVVLVELKARFDEANNIEWSRQLEKAGCQVIYGLEGFKVHSKICHITMKDKDGISYITQIGTGNYNEKTARLYTDLSIISTDQTLGEEASVFFQDLTKGETVSSYSTMLTAPVSLQSGILELIDEQIANVKAGKEGYIGLKMNSLTDKTIIDALYKASSEGVKIDLIVRGICCLVPNVEGQSTNIRVISIVGRLLEHSRIYIFGKDDNKKVFISSADMMTRNTLRRVEIALLVKDEHISSRICEMFDTMLKDNCQGYILKEDGDYEKIESQGEEINSQETFYDQAYANSENKEVVKEVIYQKKDSLFKRIIERIYSKL